MDLPELSEDPSRHPDCCLSLSTKLLDKLTGTCRLSQTASHSLLVLSVGSGTGLLEAHLQAHWSSTPECNLTINGIEVRTSDPSRPVNKYLREENYSTVRGTWEVSPLAPEACVLMFVYPREPGLITRYVQEAVASLQAVVWLGPNVDWEQFEGCLKDASRDGSVEIVEQSGLVGYETMAIVRTRLGT